jgi:hypothetical protein
MWDTSDVTFYGVHSHETSSGETHKLYGVRFRASQIYELAGVPAGEPEDPQPEEKKGKGGRPSGKNGEPIATFTIRLLNRWPVEDSHDALGAELEAVYAELKLGKPAPDNARKDAVGVLEAIKASKKPK